MNQKPTNLLRLEEVAVALGGSFQGVRNLIAAGELTAVRVGERGVRVREEDVAKLIERGAEPSKTSVSQKKTKAEVTK